MWSAMAQASGRAARARAAMELKLAILSTLNKLGDRDTQQMAVEDLQRIAEGLAPESISVFLTCLYEVSTDQKSMIRRESVKLFGTLACLYGDLLIPHVPKIVACIMRRLKDTDTQIRDACADAMGQLVAQVQPLNNADNGNMAGSSGSLAVFTKPLFDTMNEQTKHVQVGAALCLARIIECAPCPSPLCIQRLCPRMAKFLSSPTFMAKSALLAVVGSLARVARGSNPHIQMLVPCVQDSLMSSDWAARKASAETLALLACSALSNSKGSCLAALEACRFDKVKPVRDAVAEAIQVWKSVPDSEPDNTPPTTKDNGPNEHGKCWKQHEYVQTSSHEAIPTTSTSQLEITDKSVRSALKKKTPSLSDKKTNPDFFRKLESKSLEDWQVEVAVPKGSPVPLQEEELLQKLDKVINNTESIEKSNSNPLIKKVEFVEEVQSDANRTPNEIVADSEANSAAGHNSGVPRISSRTEELGKAAPWLDTDLEPGDGHSESWDATATDMSLSASHGRQEPVGAKWGVIQSQISQLEHGQSDLLEMLQDFMCSCQENMLSLEARIQRLEEALEDITQHIVGLSGREHNGQHQYGFVPARFTNAQPSSRTQKLNDEADYVSRLYASATENARKNQLTQALTEVERSHVLSFKNSTEEHPEVEFKEQPAVTRRSWDRASGTARLGEGPSARSVWQASKDEATLAAIRVAGVEDALLENEKLPTPAERDTSVESETQTSWALWNHILDSVANDIDSAYQEALVIGDERLLVRLMNKTGPVLEHLSTGTAPSMLKALLQILQGQKFHNFVFPWLQQVADLIRKNGPEFLMLSLDAKKLLVSSLHETSAMDFPERWMGNAVAKLALQLAAAWSIDLLDG